MTLVGCPLTRELSGVYPKAENPPLVMGVVSVVRNVILLTMKREYDSDIACTRGEMLPKLPYPIVEMLVGSRANANPPVAVVEALAWVIFRCNVRQSSEGQVRRLLIRVMAPLVYRGATLGALGRLVRTNPPLMLGFPVFWSFFRFLRVIFG